MRRRKYILIFLGIVGLFLLWVIFDTPRTKDSIFLSVVTNSIALPPGQATFQISNGAPTSIFLSDMVVEIKTPRGWQTFTNVSPTNAFVTAGTATKLVVEAPKNRLWRLRVTYGDEVRYPMLLAAKIQFAISDDHPGRFFKRLRPGDTWSGSNSVVSAEIK